MPIRPRPIPLLALTLSAWACGGEPESARPAALEPALARSYLEACAGCHARPGIGVPVTGVAADWRERRTKGVDVLLENTVNGLGGMPPLGTCGLCSESDLRALVRYVAGLP